MFLNIKDKMYPNLLIVLWYLSGDIMNKVDDCIVLVYLLILKINCLTVKFYFIQAYALKIFSRYLIDIFYFGVVSSGR
jgi:hypothetical protein